MPVDRPPAPSDVHLFARAVDHEDIDLSALSGPLRDADDPRHHLALLSLEHRARLSKQASELRQCAKLLPRRPAPLAASSILLAKLYRLLWRWLPARELPAWRQQKLCTDPAVALAWLRTETCVAPSTLATPSSAIDLAAALVDLSLEEIDDPRALILALAARDEGPLQALALKLLRTAVERAAIIPKTAHQTACDLLLGPPRVMLGALELLAESWCLGLPLHASHLREALGAGEKIARAALHCSVRRRLEGPLHVVLEDPGAPPRLRQQALRGLGSVIRRDGIPTLIGLALTDTILLAQPAFDALTMLHHRGHFIDDETMPRLLQLFVGAPGYPAESLANLAYTGRNTLFTVLQSDPPEDLCKRRRVALALALAELPQAATLPIIEWLRSLAVTDDPHGAAALSALARLDADGCEALALARLDHDPKTSLAALRRVGGAATTEALLARLGITPAGPMSPCLLPHVSAAVDLLWQLTAEDHTTRELVLSQLKDDDLGATIVLDLSSGLSPRASEIIATRARPPVAASTSAPLHEQVTAIDSLTRLHQAALLPAIRLQLRAIIGALAGGEIFDETLRGEAQQVVPSPVIEALRRLGRWFAEHGRIRPVALLDAPLGSAGDILAAELLLDGLLLSKEADEAGEARLAVTLRSLAGLDAPRIYPAVLPLLRSKAPMIRKLVIPLLARHGGPALITSLRSLSGADDPETMRQAILALAEIGDKSASHELVAALEHRNMNIKKAAAAALARAGSCEAVGRLLWWLGHHDNPGLRDSLISALRSILGASLPTTLLAAIATAKTSRRRGLLLDAIGPALDPLALRAALREDAPWLPLLIDRLNSGTIRLRPALAIVEAELNSAGLPEPRGRSGDSHRLFQKLARNGLNREVETALLALRQRRPLTRRENELVGAHIEHWLELASAAPLPALEHLRIAVDALQPTTTINVAHRRVLCRHRGLVIAGCSAAESPLAGDLFVLLEVIAEDLGPAEIWLFAQDLRGALATRGIDQIGRSPLALLRRCGHFIDRDDLQTALNACERAENPPHLRRQVLADAFLHRHIFTISKVAAELATTLSEATTTRTGAALEILRKTWQAPREATIIALISIYNEHYSRVGPTLINWLCELQPLGAALAEPDSRQQNEQNERMSERRPLATDLDQPPSTVLFERLCLDLALDPALDPAFDPALDPSLDPDFKFRRCAAAIRLIEHFEHLTPQLRVRLIAGFIAGVFSTNGEIERRHGLLRVLAEHLAELPTPAVAEHLEDLPWLTRLAALLCVPAARTSQILDRLIASWSLPDLLKQARTLITSMIFAYDRHEVRIALQEPLLDGAWGTLELLRAPLRSSTLDLALLNALPASRRVDLEARLLALRGSARAPLVTSAQEPSASDEIAKKSRTELFAALRSADARAASEELGAALKALSRSPDDEFVELCALLVEHAQPRLRLAAYRHLRRHGTREATREATRILLQDPRADIQRSAISSAGHARDALALPAIVTHLSHRNNGVRRAALAAIRLYGAAGIDALEAAMRNARPDHRRQLQKIAAELRERDNSDNA